MIKALTKLKLKKKHLLLAVILLAIFFRFWKMGDVPPGLYPDVAVNGTDAINANETLNYQLFYPNNNGREGLFINLIAASFKIFGVGIWQLKLIGILAGILTVYGIYLLTKEIFEEKIALLASLFAATSFWAVNFSRIGFRAIMVPLILVFSFYFLLKNLKKDKKSIWDFLIAGAIFGLGFHTYISFRIAPLILIIILGYLLINNFSIIKKYWKGIALFAIACTLIVLPILAYFMTNSQDAAERTGQVSIFNPEVNKGNFPLTLTKTTGLSLGMFNFYGDPNWRHNFPGLPNLNIIVGIFFLIGIFFLFKQFFSKNEEKQVLGNKFAPVFLISWLLIMLIPAILTEEGMPHSLRAIGSQIPAFIIAGLGAYSIYLYLKQKNKNLAKKTLILIPVIIILDFIVYFQVWAKKPEVIDQFTSRFVEISKYMNTLPASKSKYVIVNEPGVMVNGFPVQAQTIKMLTYKKSNIIFLDENNIEKINFPNNSVLVPLREKEKMKELINKNPSVLSLNEVGINTKYENTNFIAYLIK